MRKLAALFLAILSSFLVTSGQVDTSAKPSSPTNDYSESVPYNSLKSSKYLIKKPKKTNQSPSQTTTNRGFDNKDIIKIDSTLVTVPVSISNSASGIFVTNLVKEDFKVFEDGIEQKIAYFGVSDVPLTVILLLDVSTSTKYKIEEIREAAAIFVNQLNPQDRVEIIKFNRKVKVLVRATRKRKKIFKALEKVKFGGGTSLYDAVDITLDERLRKVKGRKAIVLFTDGVDTTSKYAFFDDTVKKAEKSNTILFPIFYDTYVKALKKGSRSSVRELGERKLGKMYLDELAILTGGRLVEPDSTSDGLNQAFAVIADDLRHQYTLGFYPIKVGKRGQRKTLKVRVFRTNLNVRARGSYIVSRK